MCQFISFFHRPDTGDIAVWDLNSHSNTGKHLKLNLNLWCEGHYLPDGTIEARIHDKIRESQKECEDRIKTKFPTFLDFLNWCFKQDINIVTSLDLSSLTNAKGLVIPQGVTSLYLRSEIKKELGL